jgi:diguanylate cyclase
MSIVYVLASRYTRSLGAIASAARQIEQGAVDTEIPAIIDVREVHQLSSALRGMQHALQQREAALAAANAELESRVLERTSQLEAAREELQRANQSLEALAQRDALTGLYNRRTADATLLREIARHQRTGGALALALLDVDRFKSINDSHGHQTGDVVLKQVANTLLESCRSTDFVARFGGEEFVVLLPDTPPEGAAVVAEKLRATIEAAAIGPTRATVSIGLAPHVERYADELAALGAADEALYAAKRGGRNRVVVCNVPVSVRPRRTSQSA